MAEIDPSQLGPDELFLSGRLQVDTAIDVLAMADVNPAGLEMLKTQRAVHAAVTEPGAQNDMVIRFQGGPAQQIREDIAASALLAERNQTLPDEKRTAARALLVVLGVEI